MVVAGLILRNKEPVDRNCVCYREPMAPGILYTFRPPFGLATDRCSEALAQPNFSGAQFSGFLVFGSNKRSLGRT